MNFSYRCATCGTVHTLVFRIGEAPQRTKCPHCGQDTLVRTYEPTPNVWHTKKGV